MQPSKSRVRSMGEMVLIGWIVIVHALACGTMNVAVNVMPFFSFLNSFSYEQKGAIAVAIVMGPSMILYLLLWKLLPFLEQLRQRRAASTA